MIETLNQWLKARGMDELKEKNLPDVFFFDEHAAGFLIETNVGLALIDYIVSNPGSPRRKVHDSISSGIEFLLGVAKKKGFSKVLGFTNKRGVMGIARSQGFNCGGDYTLLERGI